MGTGRIQRGVLSVAAAVTGLSAAVANPSASLEDLAQTEFVKAGAAMREQLERQAAGDPSGARLAADDAELHRSQYRHLMRELTRARSAAPISSSVAAPRDPFVPDATSWSAAEAGPLRVAITGSRTQDGSRTVSHAPWDLYRRRGEPEGSESTDTAKRADAAAQGTDDRVALRGDLYSTGRIAGAWVVAPGESSANAASQERSNEPFLVDRHRAAADAAQP